MNLQKVREIIQLYKKHFKAISREEIYKWQAVKCFQDNWDIKSSDFYQMVENSFSSVKNLMDSGQYFPKRMLLRNSEKEPETIRNLFIKLFDEENDWKKRLSDFKTSFNSINKKYFPGKKSYQDDRAIMVYLSLRFPNTYFLYKFKMFKKFIEQIDYPYKPIGGRLENLIVYDEVCRVLRNEISKDSELLEMHKNRISDQLFYDESLNILTQDVIYASVRHFQRLETESFVSAHNRLKKVEKKFQVKPASSNVKFKGTGQFSIEKEFEKKKIGFLGELLVLEYEKDKLQQLGSRKQPEHISITKGDGEGYDILSYDENGKEMLIEVKTTKNDFAAPFYITRNELEKSKLDNEKFYLYRLFDFDEINSTAFFTIHKGNLEFFCTNPILYKVNIDG
jgi:Domain of unknown function (DUF3883)